LPRTDITSAPGPDTQQYYRLKDIRAMYPAVREVYLRYLDNWGLIVPAVRTGADIFYSFTDLLVVKQVAAGLERGARFQAVLKALVAERAGQLAFDFRPSRGEAHPAKVIALERPSAPAAPARFAPPDPGSPGSSGIAALAAQYFTDGTALDDGSVATQEAAAAAYRHALLIDPGLVPALVNLANIHYARDQSIEAQALYERAIRLEPDCFEAHFNLGNIYHDLGRYEEAQACYRDALALNAAYPDAHFYLAVTLEKMGQSHDAKPHWRIYQQLAPQGEWIELAREFSD
jgi:tetratricopeptide (TPR) repeat protein